LPDPLLQTTDHCLALPRDLRLYAGHVGYGDTNGNKTVNASDIGETKAQSGQAVTAANFRQDVTPNGSINASDIGLVKSRSGASVP